MKKALSYLISTLVFNTAIAGVLTMLMQNVTFWQEFIYSQCIGLSVIAVNGTLVNVLSSSIMRWAILGISLPGSVLLGMALAFSLSGVGEWRIGYVLPTMVLGLFFGLIGAIVVLLSERIAAEIQQRQFIKSESEKREVEAHLRLLQAQIEPHFLFNTLANVGSLIEVDPALARQLLDRLNDWLRVALARARSVHVTLGDELDMLENYLQILKIRFGDRLRWNIEVSEAERLCYFPPMLLQPLVENAVRHGIEPMIGGGVISIRADSDSAALRIEVSDSGVGLIGDEKGGAGLSNVRERLAALFGGEGGLVLSGKAGGGVTARLELPK